MSSAFSEYITHRFWQRASAQAPKAARERFVKSWGLYLGSVVQQAERRSASYICSMDEYMASRRLNIGCDPSFVLLEISLDLDLPHEVMEHPAIVSVNSDAQDMVILWNVSTTIFFLITTAYIAGHGLLQEGGTHQQC